MPKLHTKRKVLDGRGTVLSYERDPSVWYYRESDGAGGYRSSQLKARTELDAVSEALDAYTAFRSTTDSEGKPKPKPKKRGKSLLLVKAVDDWLRDEQAKYEANQIGESNLNNKRRAAKSLKQYLEQEGVTTTKQITENTFSRYLIFSSERTRISVKNELGYINVFLTWLKRQRLIAPDVAALKLTPSVKVSGEDLQANPAINTDDWRKFVNECKKRIKEVKHDRRLHPSWYWWSTFHQFMLIAKNSGLRPKEMLNLRWRDITLLDMGKRSETDERPHIIAEINVRKTKTREPRMVPCKSGHRFKELREFQEKYMETYYGGLHTINNNDYVFANYARCGGRPVHYKQYTHAWISIRRVVKPTLKGHWSSEHDYTIYSMRSTFIEDELWNDTPVHLVAQMSGHDIKVLMKHYQQMDGKKSMELGALPIGKTSTTPKRNIIEF